ncbi:MAG: sensor histidine kinase [Nitriliruptoraceae bacterium]
MRPSPPALPVLIRELIGVVQTLSVATEAETVQAVVLHAVRRVTGADGVTFVVRDGDRCFYVDEDAIGPLWKGQRFPASSCISGWVMEHGKPAVIPDIGEDDRIPQDAYRPTFVRSLAMVPIRALDPLGAIGVYWAQPHTADPADVEAVQAIADATAVTMERLRADRELAARVGDLEVANQRLSEANRRLEHVTGVVAHDLRSPLTTVDGLLATLEARFGIATGSMEGELLGRARTQVGGLIDTVDALLSLSQLQCTPLEVVDVPLTALVDQVVDALEVEITQAQAQVQLDADGVLRGDPVLLRILLQNLVGNAVRYRHPERRQVVRIGLARREDLVELTVTDRGIGLEPEHLDGLFQLGRLRRPPGDGQPGAGLGLVTCRHIVERHGGTIAAEPRRGGARFVVRLPGDRTP